MEKYLKESYSLDHSIGHWIIGVPYIFTGNMFENAERRYFIHENTYVYTKHGIHEQFYIVNDKVNDTFLIDPRAECARFFMAMNPYIINPTHPPSMRINGQIVIEGKIKEPRYLTMWKSAINSQQYCNNATVNMGDNMTVNFKIRTNCDFTEMHALPYTVDEEVLQKTMKYDWNGIAEALKRAAPRTGHAGAPVRNSRGLIKRHGQRGPPRGDDRAIQDSSIRAFKEYITYLPKEFPRKKWNKHIHPDNLHWGQLKLLLSEIEFLTSLGDATDEKIAKTPHPGKRPLRLKEGKIVVYAGAAAGYHIPLLSRMFPHILFILYDPAKFGIHPTPNIIIRNEFFTDEIAKMYHGIDVVFISDIRLSEEDEKAFEERVHQDNVMVERWVDTIDPVESMLKFRFPFTWNVEKNGPYKYLSGKINVQNFAPPVSAETRLTVGREDKGEPRPLREYDVIEYEQQLFYFNVEYRNKSFLDLDPVFGQNYDTYSLYLILKNYLLHRRIITDDTPKEKVYAYVSAIILEIQSELHNDKLTRSVFPWLK